MKKQHNHPPNHSNQFNTPPNTNQQQVFAQAVHSEAEKGALTSLVKIDLADNSFGGEAAPLLAGALRCVYVCVFGGGREGERVFFGH